MVVERTPDEQYLEDAIRDGMAVRREVSMAMAVTANGELQCRVKSLDLNHVERLRESLRDIRSLRSIVLFRGEHSGLWLADGFHRREAYRLEGFELIPSYVIEGGYREALRFSTMCNRQCCLKRTLDDIKKAALLLFVDPEWSRKSSGMIAEHIGCSSNTLDRWREQFWEDNGMERPSSCEMKNGRIRSLRPKAKSQPEIEKKSNHRIITGSLVRSSGFIDPAECLPDGTAVIICRNRPVCSPVALAKRIGVKFVTPDELLAKLGGNGHS